MVVSRSVDHTEEAIEFDVVGEPVVGILHHGSSAQSTGVLMVVGGRQYRIGAHRQFVSLARHLSQKGYQVLRFDIRGMGDSSGEPISFLDTAPDISAALREFRIRKPRVEKIILWGLCDGASAAVLYASEHSGVDGVMMVNPWITTDGGLARTRLKHYYTKRLISASFWRKILTGSVSFTQSFLSLGLNLKNILFKSTSVPESGLSLPDRVFKAMVGFNGYIALIISEKDLTAREFKDEYDKREDELAQAALPRCFVSIDADHTFSTPETQARLEALTAQWLETKKI